VTPRGARGRADRVEAAAGDLYGLPLDEFTSARNERAKKARAEADRAQRQARKDADRADRAARQAERRLADATSRRKNLEP
jgi:hypothetical protein